MSDEDIKSNLYINLLNVIKSVDGITDKDMIKEWIGSIPAPYVTKIINAVDHTNNWGPDLKVELICKDCQKAIEVEIPINPVSFFS